MHLREFAGVTRISPTCLHVEWVAGETKSRRVWRAAVLMKWMVARLIGLAAAASIRDVSPLEPART